MGLDHGFGNHTMRKANAIHKWFIDNVNDGIDDCTEFEVSVDDMEKLLNLINRVLDDHSMADLLLPTQSGFFFGSIEYDHYYFQDLLDCKEALIEMINEGEPVTYWASW